MAAASWEQVQQGLKESSEHLKQARKEAQGVSDAFGTLLKTMLPAVAGFEGLSSVFGGLSRYAHDMKQGLTQTANELERALKYKQGMLAELFLQDKITYAQRMEETEVMKKQAKVHEAQLRVAGEVEKAGGRQLAIAKGLLFVTAALVVHNRQLNQSLINANSSYGFRNKLMQDTLTAQIKTGASFSDVTEAAKALTFWGAENLDNFQDLVVKVQQLSDGLGMGVQEAAELAAVVERRLGGDFQKVADTMAELVNSTALTADEAGRLATNLARVMETVQPGMAKVTLSEVTKTIGVYESAFKRMGGQAGTVEQFLSKMATPEGMLGAGALGASPEFIGSAAGVQSVMQNFQKYAENLLQNSRGWDRQMRLDALGQQFNISAGQAALLLQVMQDQNKEVVKATTLQERFQEQMASTGMAFVQIGNTLLGLVQGGLYYPMRLLSAILNQLNQWLQALMSVKEVVPIVMGAVVVGITVLIYKLRHLIGALYDVAFASHLAAVNLARQARIAGAGAAGAAGTGFFATTFGLLLRGITWIARLLVGIGIGLAAGAAIAGAILYWTHLEYRAMQKAQTQEKEAKDRLAMSNQAYTTRIGSMLAQGFRSGNTAFMTPEWQKQFQNFMAKVDWGSQISGYGSMSATDKKAAQDKAVKDTLQELENAWYNKTRFDNPGGVYALPTQVDRDNYALFVNMLKAIEYGNGVAQKRMDADIKVEEKRKIEEAQKSLLQKGVDAFKNAQDVWGDVLTPLFR